MSYEKDGFVQAPVAGMLAIVLGIGITVLILILVSVIAGSTWTIAGTDVTSVTNVTIRDAATHGIEKSFSGLETAGKYMPLVVIGLMAVLVIGALMMFGGTQQGGGL